MVDMYLTKGRWKLDHASKIDVLEEPAHTHLIYHFLEDSETKLEYEGEGAFVLYGPDQALLVKPALFPTALLLCWHYYVRGFFDLLR